MIVCGSSYEKPTVYYLTRAPIQPGDGPRIYDGGYPQQSMRYFNYNIMHLAIKGDLGARSHMKFDAQT